MIKQIIFLAVFSWVSMGYSQSRVYFQEEDLTFTLTDSAFTVKGIYYLYAEQSTTMDLFYPLPSEEVFGKISNIRIVEGKTGTSLPYSASDSAVVFTMKVDGITPLYIEYSQAIVSNRARYILMSTHHWLKPLQKAHFKLIATPGKEIKHFSMPPHQEIIIDNQKMFLWNFTDFLPETDFEIFF